MADRVGTSANAASRPGATRSRHTSIISGASVLGDARPSATAPPRAALTRRTLG